MSKDLQPAFFREKKGRSYAPFSRDVSVGQVDTMLMRAMHQTDRYRAMKKSGMAEADMREEFEKPVDMRVFSWDGPIDTIMSPLVRFVIIRVSCVRRLCRWTLAPGRSRLM